MQQTSSYRGSLIWKYYPVWKCPFIWARCHLRHATHNGLMNHSFLKAFLVPCKRRIFKQQCFFWPIVPPTWAEPQKTLGYWISDAFELGGLLSLSWLMWCWPKSKLQPPGHSAPPSLLAQDLLLVGCILALSCPKKSCFSAIPACLGVREGLINSPGLRQSWGLAVTACLRIPGTHFSLDPLGAVALLIE